MSSIFQSFHSVRLAEKWIAEKKEQYDTEWEKTLSNNPIVRLLKAAIENNAHFLTETVTISRFIQNIFMRNWVTLKKKKKQKSCRESAKAPASRSQSHWNENYTQARRAVP